MPLVRRRFIGPTGEPEYLKDGLWGYHNDKTYQKHSRWNGRMRELVLFSIYSFSTIFGENFRGFPGLERTLVHILMTHERIYDLGKVAR